MTHSDVVSARYLLVGACCLCCVVLLCVVCSPPRPITALLFTSAIEVGSDGAAAVDCANLRLESKNERRTAPPIALETVSGR